MIKKIKTVNLIKKKSHSLFYSYKNYKFNILNFLKLFIKFIYKYF